jgi:tetratricopeptide (TPR) repeat protein
LNRLAEAEQLLRRALIIDEKSFGPEHPSVARDLNNLARLLQATNQLGEAEPLMRRNLEIFLNFTTTKGHDSLHLLTAVENYRLLLLQMGRSNSDAMAQIKFIARPFDIPWLHNLKITSS